MPSSSAIDLGGAGMPALAATVRLDRLSQRDFQRLARFIQDYSGIKMPPTKATMVEGRLRRRVAALRLPDLAAYCRHLFDDGGLEAEAVHLIDAVTTNKTEFFREPDHFRFLAETAVPALLAERRAAPAAAVKLWSAAASIGAEAYTLAMVMADLAERFGGLRLSILATDICTKVLRIGAEAVYQHDAILPVPAEFRRRYLLRAKDRSRDVVRMAPEIRRLVAFRHLNLMDAEYGVDRDMDVIFCRNILIYFDKPTQQAVLDRLCSHLRPGGYLFLGHSESLAGLGLPLRAAGPTVFRRL